METTEKLESIHQNFKFNIDRVKNIISIYETSLGKETRGRKSVEDSDILRAAIIFLHASMEEFLRGVAVLFWPMADESVLNEVPISGTDMKNRPEKFLLGKLTKFRGKKVDEILESSVFEYCNQYMNFNNTTDVSSFLRSVRVKIEKINQDYDEINNLMTRRHQIVHQADRNKLEGGKGVHATDSISQKAVTDWVEIVILTIDKIKNELTPGTFKTGPYQK